MLVLLATHAWRFAAVAPVLLLVVVGPLQAATDPATAGRPPLYAIVASGALSIALVAAFVGLCVRHATRPHPLFRLVSEASYWTYVAHFPLVILLQVVRRGCDPGAAQVARDRRGDLGDVLRELRTGDPPHRAPPAARIA